MNAREKEKSEEAFECEIKIKKINEEKYTRQRHHEEEALLIKLRMYLFAIHMYMNSSLFARYSSDNECRNVQLFAF